MSKKRKKTKGPTSTIYIKDLPADLKFQFKAYCSRRGKTIKQVIIRFMKKKTKPKLEQ